MPPKRKLKTALQNVLADSKRRKVEDQKTKVRADMMERQKQNAMYGGRRQKKLKTCPQGQDSVSTAIRHTKPLIVCNEKDRVLLVGEGNFSFAASLVHLFYMHGAEHLTATCFDSKEVLYEKYGDEAKENIDTITTMGGTILFDVDATKIDKHQRIGQNRYSKIIFNFPHAGKGIKDEQRNIESNQALLSGFFKAASALLTHKHNPIDTKDNDDAELTSKTQAAKARPDGQLELDGEVYVTMKTGKPYDDWKVKFVAKWTGVMGMKTSMPFDPHAFPGYCHRRTIGFKDGMSMANNEEILKANPRTCVFVHKHVIERRVEHAKQGKRLAAKNRQSGKHRKLEADSDDEAIDRDRRAQGN
ncbi:hypothetical protein DM01DRAFT_1334239 [Hesseltinella vesiculosa]|uniref:25S rRNA (uridine-N(3))-methyltransferase BMT5-like domain-containing protein n=1 Tax=Hesseltinella vesiculosa TaxID=101127 RepID=A0A1X2GNC2_9FUNG|nr:hypothetical protein DM01DRAFT_1334239 [Hesseltinella vesiculosa]